jgi:hypothetical protein
MSQSLGPSGGWLMVMHGFLHVSSLSRSILYTTLW